MPLKFKITELFKGKFVNSINLYKELESLDKRIDNKSDAKAVVKKDVKLNKTQLKKAFGNPKNFDKVGVVLNSEGAYIVIADGDKKFYFATLDEV